MHVQRSGIMGMNFVLLRYFQGLLYFLCIFDFRQSWDVWKVIVDIKVHPLQ